jgi:hypothetical protein
MLTLETPVKNTEIYLWMYMRKVSEDHLPNFLMVLQLILLSFMAMAPLAQRECELMVERLLYPADV